MNVLYCKNSLPAGPYLKGEFVPFIFTRNRNSSPLMGESKPLAVTSNRVRSLILTQWPKISPLGRNDREQNTSVNVPYKLQENVGPAP